MSHGPALRRGIALFVLAAAAGLLSCIELPLVELPDEEEVHACAPDDALEDNDVPADAWFVELGSHAAILCANDEGVDADFFTFEGKPHRRYHARLEGMAAADGWMLSIFDAASFERIEIDTLGFFTLPDTGVIYLQVEASEDALAAGHEAAAPYLEAEEGKNCKGLRASPPTRTSK